MSWTPAIASDWTKPRRALAMLAAFTALGCAGDVTGGVYGDDARGAARNAQFARALIEINDGAHSRGFVLNARPTFPRHANHGHSNRPRLIPATLMGPGLPSTSPSGEVPSPTEQFKGHFQKREFDGALEIANKMIRERPGDPVGYNLQGEAYLD